MSQLQETIPGIPAIAASVPSRTQAAWQQYTYDRLDELREQWADADHPPFGTGVLSSGEHAALALACGHERVMHSPLVAFVLLDGWLQRWVMQHRGLAHLVGGTIGV